MSRASLCKNSIRILFVIISLGSFPSCTENRQQVTMTGSTPGLNGYVISLYLGDSTVAGENISDGRFSIKTSVPREDFYTLQLHPNDPAKPDHKFLVYLTEGEYSLQTDSTSLSRYPLIKSASQVQNDLTEYYRIQDRNSEKYQDEYERIKRAYDSDELNLDSERFNEIAGQFVLAESRLSGNIAGSRKEFISKNPQSIVSAYFLDNSASEIEYDAGAYFQIFEKLGPEARESRYGQSAKKLIDRYRKGAPNTLLPDIAGELPDGKPFDKNVLKGKLSLIMFWMSSNKDSRDDIGKLTEIYRTLHPQGFEIVGIAFDTSKERYQSYLAQQNLPWIQVYDAKWTNSENMKNFGNSVMPYYFLVGPDLKIIERNPPLESIAIYHKEYLAHQNQREKLKAKR